jgi:hypothetical protein
MKEAYGVYVKIKELVQSCDGTWYYKSGGRGGGGSFYVTIGDVTRKFRAHPGRCVDEWNELFDDEDNLVSDARKRFLKFFKVAA